MTRVVIIGAGIVGAACARALSLRGCAVTVVDKRPPGDGATAAGMGHLVVMDDSPAQFALCRLSQNCWDELETRLPGDCEFDRCGTLWAAADAEEMEEVGRKADFYAQHDISASILDDKQLAEAEPNLRDGLAGGLVVPGDSVIYPPCAARFLMEEARSQGAIVRIGHGVQRIESNRVVLENDESFVGDWIVNSAGASAARITPGLPLRPRKGHLVITDRYPGFVRHQILELGYLKSAHGDAKESVAFNVQPRRTGQLLLGSSRQFDVESATVDHPLVARMIDRALLYMPTLSRLSVLRIWTGFRAATPDSLPLIGPHPAHPELIVATGHEGLGITTSLGTAELVAAHVTGGSPPIDPTPYRVGRFEE